MFETVMHFLGLCGENHPSVLWIWMGELYNSPVFLYIKMKFFK